MKNVAVDITDRGAIYVDNTRITNRNTKWGYHTTLNSFVCEKEQVVSECYHRGYYDHIRNIDDHFYLDQARLYIRSRR